MKKNTWIFIGVGVLLAALAAVVIVSNCWFNSGNVRTLGKKLRVELSGVGYVISQETGKVIGQAPMNVEGSSSSADQEVFQGDLEIMGYINEADGEMTSNKGVRKGDNGYWEIHHLDNCRHVEENENGNKEVVNHSCKYSYIYYVHPDRQDFVIARVKDKYAMFPLYVVLADSELEALSIYQEFINNG